MIDALAFGSVGLVVASAVLLALLVVRRFAHARDARRRAEAEARLRPLALALVDGEADPPPLGGRDAAVFASLLGRYARRLRGTSAARIAEYFERNGLVDAEVAALADRRSWRRAEAAHLLGDMSSGSAVPALLRVLDDRERAVRAAAARSLGRLGAVEAVAPLVQALAARLVPPAVAGFALVQIGPAALPRLTELLAHEDPGVRTHAAELVGLVGDGAAGRSLLHGLRDSSAEVRATCARALGRLAAEEAAAELRSALSDRVPFVRTAVAHALGAIGDRAAFEPLLAQARTDVFDPARAAASALAEIDPRRLAALVPSDGAPHLLEAADLAAAR